MEGLKSVKGILRLEILRVKADFAAMSALSLPLIPTCWLVGCFGFNGPLRQYFSLYRAVSQRGEKEEKKDRGE